MKNVSSIGLRFQIPIKPTQSCLCPILLRDKSQSAPILRAALHIEAGPIRCVRGLKSSLVIGQKAQIGPNSFTSRGHADLVV